MHVTRWRRETGVSTEHGRQHRKDSLSCLERPGSVAFTSGDSHRSDNVHGEETTRTAREGRDDATWSESYQRSSQLAAFHRDPDAPCAQEMRKWMEYTGK